MSAAPALRQFDSEIAVAIYDSVNSAHNPERLDELAKYMWQAVCAGQVTEKDAGELQACINLRRPLSRATAPGHALKVGKLAGRIGSRFKPRQHPRSPDRAASRERRRVLGGSAVLPPQLRSCYTEGQRSVLAIIAGEAKHHGVCDLPLGKIAALAGVCRTTVQTTLHEARRLFHIRITERPRPGQKHLTNVVEIISREWQTWIKRGPTAHRPAAIGSKIVSTTKNTELIVGSALQTKAQKVADGRGNVTRLEPYLRC